MRGRKDFQHLFAVVSLSGQAACNLRESWSEVVPTTFPSIQEFHHFPENGVAISGNCFTRAHRTYVIASRVGNHLEANDVLEGNPSSVQELMCSSNKSPFSLAVFDNGKRKFTVARDVFGQTSLYYRQTSSHLFFSSKLESLLDDRSNPNRLDHMSAINYLLYGRPLLSRTLAEGVAKVPAGQCIDFTCEGTAFRRRYYSPLNNKAQKVLLPPDKAELTEKLERAVCKRASSVNQAVLLSGGIDSSFLTSILTEKRRDLEVRPYTIEFEPPYQDNETEYASIVADANGIGLSVVHMGVNDAIRHLPDILKLPEPASAWACLTHLKLLEQLAADGHSTFISGLGADEIFGGYSRFLAFYRKFRFGEDDWQGPRGQGYFDMLVYRPVKALRDLFPGVPEFFTLSQFRKVTSTPYSDWSPYLPTARFYEECQEIKSSPHVFELMVAHECQHRIPDLLFTSFEAPSEKYGVYGSYPFLDEEVVSMACGLGAAERFWLKGGRWQNKKLLKEIAAPRLPPQILNRKIGSYTTPISMWLTDRRFKNVFREHLLEADLWKTGLVAHAARKEVDDALFEDADRSTPKRYSSALGQAWVMVTLAAWYDHWVSPASASSKERHDGT